MTWLARVPDVLMPPPSFVSAADCPQLQTLCQDALEVGRVCGACVCSTLCRWRRAGAWDASQVVLVLRRHDRFSLGG